MEKLLYFVGGIIVGSISTLAALGFKGNGKNGGETVRGRGF